MLDIQEYISCTAFAGAVRIASGELQQVALKAKAVLDRSKYAQVLIFDDRSSEVIEVDFRGTPAEVSERIGRSVAVGSNVEEPQPVEEMRRPGRPKLGVVAREVTLVPRHWDWLANQPGGASVALRKLVDHARLANKGKDQLRRARDSAYRFLSAMAGNEPGFEEATRALFAGQRETFNEWTEPWPRDVRDHARNLAAACFE